MGAHEACVCLSRQDASMVPLKLKVLGRLLSAAMLVLLSPRSGFSHKGQKCTPWIQTAWLRNVALHLRPKVCSNLLAFLLPQQFVEAFEGSGSCWTCSGRGHRAWQLFSTGPHHIATGSGLYPRWSMPRETRLKGSFFERKEEEWLEVTAYSNKHKLLLNIILQKLLCGLAHQCGTNSFVAETCSPSTDPSLVCMFIQ